MNISKNDLQSLVLSGLTNVEIANLYNVSRSTIISKLKRYNIKRKKLSKKILLENLPKYNYIKDFAWDFGFNEKTVSAFIHRHNIPFKKNQYIISTFLKNKEWLVNEYLVKNRSLTDISKELKCSRDLIKTYLTFHNINQKPRNKERVWHIDFSNIDWKNKTSLEVAKELNCSEEYVRQYQIDNNIPRKSGCNQSKQEREFIRFLTLNNINTIENSKSIIPPYEIDIYLPEYKIGIELHGVYWHSIKFVSEDYHYKKRKLAEEKGIRLIQIFEDSFNDKKEKYFNEILKLTSNKIHSSDCKITKDTNRIKKFLKKNSIQKFDVGLFFIGLERNNEIVMAATFNENELIAYVSTVQIINGLSTMINTLGFNTLMCTVDYLYNDGVELEENGFIKISEELPTYKYMYGNKLHENKIKNNNLKVFDCGKGIYQWRK
jgi:DNA-binding CsgD family transcriptional regulator